METQSHSIRVLVRPPPPPAPLPPQPPPTPPPGVVVVGFIGRRHHDVAHLINKIADSYAFGSGGLDTPLRFEPERIDSEMRRWFESRNLSFYHDQDKGILYLQFSMLDCTVAEAMLSEGRMGFESVLEDRELGDLKGFIFMFTVCHIVILIQEGSRFDTQLLKKFRVLQAAKHSIVPFIRSQNISSIASRPRSSAQSRIPATGSSFNNASPGKIGIQNRNASANAVMSGLGSYTSLLPGQCTPVVLFVFVDDFSEIYLSGNMEQSSETSSLNVSSSLNNSARPGMPAKGSSSVVVLARPVNKSEGGLRKKLQSSLEAQIRFSIKKCRTLSVFEGSHVGSRTGAVASSAPLFSLDASRAVSLVDACSTQSCESLEFAIGLVEQVLDGKATPDSLLLESHHENTNKEDIVSVKEFIHKQSDLLRGRGGLMGNGSSGAAGVGMVAAAAAAAAASTSATAASGKSISPPELPTLEIWSTSSQLILHRILSAKPGCTYEAKTNRMQEQNAMIPLIETVATSSDPYESALSHLENGIGMNTRFSTLWCEKAFPVAKEVYLEDLPPCYPSFQHEVHLKKALHAFMSMVKGPAVQLYIKKLKDECMSIWSSGRQLCDAVSLTGKPCMHQKHDIKALSTHEIKHHSSGFVYLHACACGRSRQLLPDPFDFDSANVAGSTFVDCDKLLPSIKLPEGIVKGPIQPSSWNLIRIGGARYYDPSKGLIQSGFSATEKFLLRWTIFLEKPPLNDIQQGSSDRNPRFETALEADDQTSDAARLVAGRAQNGAGTPKMPSSDITGNGSKKMSTGRGLSNFTMRKPFSEVVAGPAAANSAFPPLFSRKQPIQDAEKSVKLHNGRHRGLDKLGDVVYSQESQKVKDTASVDNLQHNGTASNTTKYGDSFPRIGSNIPSFNVNGGKQIKAANPMKTVTIYVGFEHECPHGHRFILTLDHLSDLGSSFSASEENVLPLPMENSDRKQDPTKLGKLGNHGRTRRQAHGLVVGGAISKAKNPEKSKEKVANGDMPSQKSMQSTRHGKNQNERTEAVNLVEDLDSNLKPTSIDDHGGAFSLLNRNLPIYMNCPHCRESRTKNDTSNVKYASAISQLQRIFVVTPSFPIVLAASPVIQFELSCLPPSVPDREQKLQFSLGCPAILPPDSFLSLRLPFVYGVELEDGSLHSLKPFENQPHLTAYIMRGTTLQVMSNRSALNPESATWSMSKNLPAT
ncbi:uncharacterized protein LOC131019918 [Salvia miltiorrhiza]|uniref:uncharacterized protein LOC131019918 n=1 Tax=Salvia miltiorrhiza TaxID=226208 RepID=UPI0025AC2028|nr:uncharacterized protein LOC131019918 [Salvia miltiorrhiza]XP_057804533.1 uncharacterized protein LOC131019918 [Salvia miltiorrhiza]XP_057804541.1 uncharacterized protein LOC131019918 [Salvia miltiorrhiza]XP_057804548.1 uncharacterized protein LOC131019918 [Salvia miltiorrhiza]